MLVTPRRLVLFMAVAAVAGCSYNTNDLSLPDRLQTHEQPRFDRTNYNYVVSGANKLDHEPVLLARACSAHKYKHSFLTPFVGMLSQMDVDGNVDTEEENIKAAGEQNTVGIVVENVSTSLRCVLTGLYKVGCLSNMTLTVQVSHPEDMEKSKRHRYSFDQTLETKSCTDLGYAMMLLGNKMLETVHAEIQ